MRKKYAILISLLVLSGLLILVQVSCGGGDIVKFTTVTVEKARFEITIPAVGELEAVTSTPIKVPVRVRGRQTIAWLAPENSVVKKGETVARFDAAWYRDRVKRETYGIAKLDLDIRKRKGELDKERTDLQSEVDIMEVEKQLAEIYSARDEELYSLNEIIDDAISLEYLKTKTTHYQKKRGQLDRKITAEMQLLQLKRQTDEMKLSQYKSGLEMLDVKAPHDGVFVYVRNWRGEEPRVGMNVWRGYELGKLPDMSQMAAKLYVLESEAGGLKTDLQVTVELDSHPGRLFKGKITKVEAMAKSRERESTIKFFEVKASLEKTIPEIMKPGNSVRAVIYVAQQDDVIAVPNQALFFEEEKAFVNVKNGSGFEKRPVELGIRSLTRTVVSNGLEEGEKILLGTPPEEEN